jgi:hypothetical protein
LLEAEFTRPSPGRANFSISSGYIHAVQTKRSTKQSGRAVAFLLSIGSSFGIGPGASVTTRSVQAAPASGRAPVARHVDTVVVIAIDGVRWQEVFEDGDRKPSTPELRDIATRSGAALGAPGHGATISASGPEFVSLPGYLELLTGIGPSGCTSNRCQVSHPTLADDFAVEPGVGPDQVAVIASWDGIARAASLDPSCITLSAGRRTGVNLDRLRYDARASALLDLGQSDGPDPGHGDFRRDRATAAIALRYLRTQRPRFLFVGLGEPDEYAHDDDFPAYLDSVRFADQVVGEAAAILQEANDSGHRSVLFVTADHGRSRDFIGHGAWAPESARVWLVASGWGIDARGTVAAPAPRHLADVAATARWLGGIGRRVPGGSVLYELLARRRSGTGQAGT